MNALSLRLGFTIYAGWLTAATILNVCIVLIAAGFNDKEMSIDES